MTEATVQQPATTTREQIWLNREQVRKEKPVYRALKRVQDVFFSLLALIVLSPLMLIVALAIVIDDPKGSPIFTQVRSGIDGKEFRIHKFRSMCVDAEAKLADLKRRTEMNGPIFKQKDDPRITRVGRFIRKCGIDELPQLWDILVGSMSIVGPRPPLPCEVAAYTDYERQRLYVRPGLTCIWQIQPNRNDVTFDEWMDMDMRYIRDRSFLLDWKLIFGTVWTVFAGTGEKKACINMPLDENTAKKSSEACVCQGRHHAFFVFHIILFSNSRRNGVHSHKATNIATLGNIK